MIASGFAFAGVIAVATTIAVRILMHYVVTRHLLFETSSTPLLAPIRDILSFLVWAGSFFGRKVRWRGKELLIQSGGRLSNAQYRTRL